MRIQGAVIREQGQTFAVVVVKSHVVQSSSAAADVIRSFAPVFGVPIVLMAQDSRGRPTFYGRPDIARFMASVPLHAVPCGSTRSTECGFLPRANVNPLGDDDGVALLGDQPSCANVRLSTGSSRVPPRHRTQNSSAFIDCAVPASCESFHL